MILLADSGSTKTAWAYGDTLYYTAGINPVRDSRESIEAVLDALPPLQPSEVQFYGAGCIAPFKTTVEDALRARYPEATVSVESDLLGAARALCGEGEGIACILGTGSNSCLYDGRTIVQQVSPLGYILGDEGSGAVLGRTLVGDALKGQLGPSIREQFLAWGAFTPADIINKVYREPQPNRFLASLVPFLALNRNDDGIHRLLIDAFRRFFVRNVNAYGRRDLPVSFVGGVAKEFTDELREAATLEGYTIGHIIAAPIERLRSRY